MEQPIPSHNLLQWVKNHAIKLVIIGLVCAGLLFFFSWLESTLTYGNRHISFHSPTLESLWEVTYHKQKLYFSAPEQGKSWVISSGKVSFFRRRYLIAARVSFLNLLGFLFIILAFITYKKRARLWDKVKQLKNYLTLHYSWQNLCAAALTFIFILSIFPIENFTYWWRPFKHLGNPPIPGSLPRFIHYILTESIIYSAQRVFYASLFTLPGFILKSALIACFVLLLLTFIPLPTILKQIDFKNLIKPLCRPLILIILAIWILTMSILPVLRNYNHLLYLNENIAQLFQAKIFQQNELAYPIEHSKEFFQFPFISDDSSWHSQFTPGYSLLLVLGLTAGVPWLLNPLLAALTIFLVYKLTSAIYDQSTAILSAILLAASPLYIQTTAGGFSHTSIAFFLCLGLFFYQKLFERPRISHALLTGLSWGMSYLISPQTTLALILPWIIYLAIKLRKDKALLFALLSIVLPLGLAIISLAAYNHQLTGQFFLFGYNTLFFAKLTQTAQPAIAGLAHTSYRLAQINYQLLGRWLPAFIFICIIPFWRKGQNFWDYLLMGGLFTILLTYVIFFTDEANFSNFLLGILPLLIILSARGILLFPERLSELGFDRAKTTGFLLLLLIFNLGLNLRTSFMTTSEQINLNHMAKQSGIKKAIIFLEHADYPQGFINNSPTLDNEIIYARNLGKYNYKLQDEFPQREYYLYDPDSDPGEEFVEITD